MTNLFILDLADDMIALCGDCATPEAVPYNGIAPELYKCRLCGAN